MTKAKTKRTAKRTSHRLHGVVSRAVEHESKMQMLTTGLAEMAGRLTMCGLGEVNFGKLARALMKCKPRKKRKAAKGEMSHAAANVAEGTK